MVFDKTGTLTTRTNSEIKYTGSVLSFNEEKALKATLRASNHPLSRTIYETMTNIPLEKENQVFEHAGKGLQATVATVDVKVGSASFVKNEKEQFSSDTSVHVSIQNDYKGKFTLKNTYRKHVDEVFQTFSAYDLSVVSGDNEGEKAYLKKRLPENTTLLFNQKPEDKLTYVSQLQKKHKNVAMIGDGLNDAGALMQSEVGIAVSEDINVFSPACDAILDANQFEKLPKFIKATKQTMSVIQYCFIISLIYNSVGLYFAVTGQLSPVIAAILMPLSSISIVVFTTIATNILGKKL